MKVLIVGINPSNKTKKQNPTLTRLNKWMDELGVDRYSFANVHDEAGEVPNVRELAKKEFTFTKNYDKIITLGVTPSYVLKMKGVDHFAMPHPSPRNRKLNDRTYESDMLKQCKDYVNERNNKSN